MPAPCTLVIIAKIMEKWNNLSAFEDQHWGRSGRSQTARPSDNIVAVSNAMKSSEYQGRASVG